MRLFYKIFILTVGIFSLGQQAAYALEGAYISGESFGQGIVIGSDAGCHILTPAHVVKEAFDVGVSLIGGGQVHVGATTIAAEDVAIVDIAPVGQICSPSKIGDLSAPLQIYRDALVTLVSPSGAVTRIPATVESYDNRFIWLKSADQQDFKQGMSGALITMNGGAIGQLQSIDMAKGEGRAIRLDYAFDVIRWYLNAQGGRVTEQQGAITPVLTGHTINETLIIRGAVSDIVNKEDGTGLDMYWQKKPVSVSVSLQGRPFSVFYAKYPYGGKNEQPREIVARVKGQDGKYKVIFRSDVYYIDRNKYRIGEVPSGLSDVEFLFNFSGDVQVFKIGTLFLE